jgi:hypothetical protein
MCLYTSPYMQDKPKLLDQVRERLRVKHYSMRTEQAYLDWIKRFILFHGNAFVIRIIEAEPVRAIRRMAYWALGWVGKPGYSSLNQDYGRVSFLNPAYRATLL